MKKALALVLALLLAFSLCACNGGGGTSNPTAQPTANNGGGTKPSGDGGTKPAPASFTYDDNAGGAANLDAFLSSRGWNLGGNK